MKHYGRPSNTQTHNHSNHTKGKGKTSHNHARDVVRGNNCSLEIGGIEMKHNNQLIKWAENHYWNSLEKDKDLILKHLDTFEGETNELLEICKTMESILATRFWLGKKPNANIINWAMFKDELKQAINKVEGGNMEYSDGICMICHNIKQVRHINIYPVGSEGLFICKVCELEILLPYIKNVMRENIKLKKEKFKQQRRSNQ